MDAAINNGVFNKSLGFKMTLINSMNQFAFKLFKMFASRHQHDSKNMCFSPLEVFNSLVMLLVGAKGMTETQLEDMLCLKDFNQPTKYKELINLIKWIIKSNHEIMVYGTVIYVDHRMKLRPEYLEKVKSIFEIKPKPIDFSKINEAIYMINKDAYEMTDGVIEGVISHKDLQDDDSQVKLVISNAVFFRGYWLFKFGDIHKEQFHYGSGSKTVQIDMMSHLGYHRYYYDEQLQAQTVSIAYASSDIRMVLIMPESITTEAITLVDKLNADKLLQLFWNLQNQPKSLTELTIPRFALEAHKVSLQRSVKQMGARSIYDPETAQLNGICANDQRIHLTKLVHKAFILVDERGSHQYTSKIENADTTQSLSLSKEHSENKRVKFKANHPFIFLILDKITGVVCFMGVFADPTQILEVVREQDLSNEEITQLLAESDQKSFLDNISIDSTSSSQS
ncbi:group 27 mite allergen-like protein [Dermatophagoides farinae]|uniref:Group 27 mite allergen-like protein n=1 Tax=Dermatophagoides farinae TaxID=6954 RepID=A0A9D4P758_DERFA|nr:group 27 mite allergen-like protein [Dermatophagoides farinae]